MIGETVIKRVKGTRKQIIAGTFFRVHLIEGGPLLGFVAKDDACVTLSEDWKCFVVYIFQPDIIARSLSIEHLLVPPLLVGRDAWTRGLFDVSRRIQASIQGVPTRHCFESLMGWKFLPDGAKIVSAYFDEYCRPCERAEPCGIQALTTLAGIEGGIARALMLKYES